MADPGYHTVKKLGEQDVYLTGNPEISFFKKVFRRHTRFFKQYVQIPFDKSGDEQFGDNLSARIRYDHHLLGEMYLELVVKGTSTAVNQYTVNHFGNSCIKDITFKIGSRTIDKHTGQWLQIYKELHEPNYKPNELGSFKSESGLGGGYRSAFYMDPTEEPYKAYNMPLDLWSIEDRMCGDCPLIFGGKEITLDTIAKVNTITWTYSDATKIWTAVTSHKLNLNDVIKFTATNASNTEYSSEYYYYVVEVPAVNQIKLSETLGGAVVSTTSNAIGSWMMQKYNNETLINKNYGLSSFGTYEKKIRVPLRFFFTKSPGLALPMCAMQRGGDPVRIDITLESGANLKGDIGTLSLSSIKLYAEKYYLSKDELTRFQNGTHMYLIEQLQINGDTAIPTYTSGTETDEKTVDLRSFMHPIKYFAFALQEEPSGGTKGIGPCYFRSLVPNSAIHNDGCYNTSTGSLKLSLDSDVTTERNELDYYTRILPKRICKGRMPDLDRIGVYSFALNPLDLDPSGTCNFSLFNQKQLNIKLSGNSDNLSGYTGNKKLLIYAINYNIFRVIGGHGGVLYI